MEIKTIIFISNKRLILVAIMIMHFVCHLTVNIRIRGIFTKKNHDANTFNFQTTIKPPIETFSQNIITKPASTSDIPNHLKSKLITPVEDYFCNKTKKNLKISHLRHTLRIFSFRRKCTFRSQGILYLIL